jgi:putative ABC transport system permease protein
MKTLQQIAAVTWMNLCMVPQRLGTSLVIVIGIGCVVAVLVSVLAMVAGLVQTMENKGHADRAIVMRYGSTSETASQVPRDTAQIVMDAPQVKHDASGQPLASIEVLRPVQVLRRSDNARGTVMLRGVGPQAAAMHPEVRIIEGRMFRPAVNEVVIGKGLGGQFEGLKVGSRVSAGRAEWTIVGVFTSDGDPHESEMMTDAETLMSAYQRVSPNSVWVALQSEALFGEFVDTLNKNPAVHVNVTRERDYYATQSRTITRLLAVMAYLVGSVMAVGAIFGALNTMYSAVSTRTREIATLRAIGFAPAGIVISVLAEALLLATAGGVVGAALAWLMFDKMSASTVSGLVGTQLVFHIAVTPGVIVVGLLWAASLGFVGGLLPAIRAARLPVATALRAS